MDAAGCPLTCQGQGALESFNKGMVAFVTLRESCLPGFKEALEKDPDFAMAHVMLVAKNRQLICHLGSAKLEVLF